MPSMAAALPLAEQHAWAHPDASTWVREPWEEVRTGKDPIHLADEWQAQAANHRTLTYWPGALI